MRTPRKATKCRCPIRISLASEAESLVGIVATHAHGSYRRAAYLADQFDCPIYTTSFTAAVLTPKLRESRSSVVEGGPRRPVAGFGTFKLTWLPITPLNTRNTWTFDRDRRGHDRKQADWKIDPTPVVGQAFDRTLWETLTHKGVDAVVCDSTNAMSLGRSLSEADLHEGLRDVVQATSGRVAVGCFASKVRDSKPWGALPRTRRYLCLQGPILDLDDRCSQIKWLFIQDFEPIPPTTSAICRPKK